MTKTSLNLAVLVSFLCVGCPAAAQDDVSQATRQTRLQVLAERLQKRADIDRSAARDYARTLGIPMRRELPDGGILELQRLRPGGAPVFYITNNLDAADTVSTDELWPGGSLGLSLEGADMTVGEWDGGAVFPDHPDFYLNSDPTSIFRLNQVDGASTVSAHSTHVAGTLIGAAQGDYIAARGMAPSANLDAYDWNSDTAEMALAAADGLLLSNHSYGIAAGWIYIGGAPPDTWWWIGGDGDEDPNFGYYDFWSRQWDQIAFDAPYYLIVNSAGNDRSDIGPAPGEEYTIIDQNGEFLTTSTVPRPPDCAPAGYDCVTSNGVAKNVLTVGAVDDLPGGYAPLSGPASVDMSPFSSWGPTDDGRIKPDLVGNGVFLLSTWPDYPYYAAVAGTSMSAPNVTGSLLLLQQHYRNLHGAGSFLRSASLKALAIHTADEAGAAPGPDYEFGWGLLNSKTAADLITADFAGGDHQIIEGSLGNGGVDTYDVGVTEADSVIKVTLVWTDPPGTPVPPALDPADLMLVNDLDLRVSRSATVYEPWVLDPSNPAAAATTGDNVRDNVEQVRVTGASPGTYTIEVSHKGTLLDGAGQNYALIVSVTPPLPTGSGFLIDEDFSGGLPPGWTVDTPSGVSWTVRAPVAGDARYDNLTGGAGNFAMVDNNYSNYTVTSLRTPVLDLSANNAAVLSFRSSFYFDWIETINVDVSTDSGVSWSNVWSETGFHPFPFQTVLDLSAAIAGRSGVMARFRFDSEVGMPAGNYWQLDDVKLEVFGGGSSSGNPPGQSSSPNPADGATGISIDANLGWTAGSQATSHDVYFGTSSPGDFQSNQTGTAFELGTLSYSTTYYWHIDEVNADGTTQGSTWSFTTEANPDPQTINLFAMSGMAIPEPRGRWLAQIEVQVQDQDGVPEDGVTVDGAWSDGANGTGSCLTAADGTCTLSKSNLKSNVASVTFTVASLSKAGMTYDAGLNQVSAAITVNQTDQNQVPVARDDSYQTGATVPVTPVSGNVIDNDDQGDGPAIIASNTVPASGILNLSGDGSFAYTPDDGFAGNDSFTYTIVDQDGDLSNWATVSITVASEPPSGGDQTLSVNSYKQQGVQHVELTWQNFSGGSVEIRRDSVLVATTANNGIYDDNIGIKGGGQTYLYEVCEVTGNVCLTAEANF